MASYYIQYSCGHEEVRELLGPIVERSRRIKWAEAYGLCRVCYGNEKDAERVADLAPLAEYLKPIDTVSERQRVFVEISRYEVIQQLISRLKISNIAQLADVMRQHPDAIGVRAVKDILEQADKEFWVTHRDPWILKETFNLNILIHRNKGEATDQVAD